MKKLLLMLAVVGAAICSTGCSEEEVVTVKCWHEFSFVDGSISGEAYTYVAGEFADFQSDYYQVNTTAEEAAAALASFCKSIEEGVASGGYEVVGDGVYATFGVIDLVTSTEPISKETAYFTKTRDEESYATFTLTFESLKGDDTDIVKQLEKLSFYDKMNKVSSEYDHSYSCNVDYDVDTDYTATWAADAAVIDDLGEMRTYLESDYIFSVRMNCSYLSYNEKTGAGKQASLTNAYVDSPSLYYHKFTRDGDDTNYPAEITFTGYSNTVEAPYFISYILNADGVAQDVYIRREGANVASSDSNYEFTINSTASAKMTTYNGISVNIDYTIGLK